jgi:serine/threonine protein phosphatase PrpC
MFDETLESPKNNELAHSGTFFQFNRMTLAESRESEFIIKQNIEKDQLFNPGDLICKELDLNCITGYLCYNPNKNESNVATSIIEYQKCGDSNNRCTAPGGYSLFSLFEGYGKSHCSKFVCENFNLAFKEKFKIQGNFSGSVKGIFQELDQKYADKAKRDYDMSNSGTSVLSLMILNDSLIGINLGGSKCIVSRNFFQEITELTESHNPDKVVELDRILSLGGHLTRAKASLKDGRVIHQTVKSYFDLKQMQKKEKEETDFEFGQWLIDGKYPVSRMIGLPKNNFTNYAVSVLNKEPQITDFDSQGNDFAVIGSFLIR